MAQLLKVNCHQLLNWFFIFFLLFLATGPVDSRFLPSVINKLKKRSPTETGRFFGNFGGLDKVKTVLTSPPTDATQPVQLAQPQPRQFDGPVMIMTEPVALKPTQRDQFDQSASQTQPLMGTYMIVQRQEISNIPLGQHHLTQMSTDNSSPGQTQMLSNGQQQQLQQPVTKQSGFPNLDVVTQSPTNAVSNEQSAVPQTPVKPQLTVANLGQQRQPENPNLSQAVSGGQSRINSNNPDAQLQQQQQPTEATVAPINSAVKATTDELPKAQFVCHLLQESTAKQ